MGQKGLCRPSPLPASRRAGRTRKNVGRLNREEAKEEMDKRRPKQGRTTSTSLQKKGVSAAIVVVAATAAAVIRRVVAVDHGDDEDKKEEEEAGGRSQATPQTSPCSSHSHPNPYHRCCLVVAVLWVWM